MNSQDGIEIVYGVDPKTFDAVTGGFSWHKGGMFKGPKDSVVDDRWAHSKSGTVGDTVELLNQQCKVTGIVEHGKGGRVFTSLECAGGLTLLVCEMGVSGAATKN